MSLRNSPVQHRHTWLGAARGVHIDIVSLALLLASLLAFLLPITASLFVVAGTMTAMSLLFIGGLVLFRGVVDGGQTNDGLPLQGSRFNPRFLALHFTILIVIPTAIALIRTALLAAAAPPPLLPTIPN